MAQIKVYYLVSGNPSNGLYSDGQSLVSKKEAMMPIQLINHYTRGAKHRGLDFNVEHEIITVKDEDVEGWEFAGYEVVQQDHIHAN